CSAAAGSGLPDRTARRKSRAVPDSHAKLTAALAAAARANRSLQQAPESQRFRARHPLPADGLAVRTNSHVLPPRKAALSQALSRTDAPAPRSRPQSELAPCLSALLCGESHSNADKHSAIAN